MTKNKEDLNEGIIETAKDIFEKYLAGPLAQGKRKKEEKVVDPKIANGVVEKYKPTK
jgi:hypothetical protein